MFKGKSISYTNHASLQKFGLFLPYPIIEAFDVYIVLYVPPRYHRGGRINSIHKPQTAVRSVPMKAICGDRHGPLQANLAMTWHKNQTGLFQKFPGRHLSQTPHPPAELSNNEYTCISGSLAISVFSCGKPSIIQPLILLT